MPTVSPSRRVSTSVVACGVVTFCAVTVCVAVSDTQVMLKVTFPPGEVVRYVALSPALTKPNVWQLPVGAEALGGAEARRLVAAKAGVRWKKNSATRKAIRNRRPLSIGRTPLLVIATTEGDLRHSWIVDRWSRSAEG